eukprot:COSAG04_NODE_30_length_35898_cov_42.288053_8_plen_133_part_00
MALLPRLAVLLALAGGAAASCDPSCKSWDGCYGCSAEQVVTAMARLPDDRDVQYFGCFALGHLAGDSPTNRAAIAAAGGIEAVTGAMARLPDDRWVQAHGCYALGNLAEDSPANRAAIAAAGTGYPWGKGGG